MPAVSLLFFGLATGVLFAWSARDEIARHEGFLGTEAVWLVGLFALLVFGPGSSYLLIANLDWTLGYFVPPERTQFIALPVLAILMTAAPVAGFTVTAAWDGAQNVTRTMRVLGILCILGCAASLPFLPRLVVDASYTQLHNDLPVRPLAGSPLGYSLLLCGTIFGLSGYWTHSAIHKNSHR